MPMGFVSAAGLPIRRPLHNRVGPALGQSRPTLTPSAHTMSMSKSLMARLMSLCLFGQRHSPVWYRPGYYDTADLEAWDPTGYLLMILDRARMEAWRSAIRRQCAGKVVLEIGAGAYAPLSRMCIEAGARRVYAIEGGRRAFEMLKAGIERDGLTDRIIPIQGQSHTVAGLPEPVDMLVHELIGEVASNEGMGAIVADAKRRFLKPGAGFIPRGCTVSMAPAHWSLEHSTISRLFNGLRRLNKPRALRAAREVTLEGIYCVWNFPASHLVGAPQEYEAIDFRTDWVECEDRHFTYAIERPGLFDGLLLWSQVQVDESTELDLWRGTHWSAIFVQLCAQPVAVQPGDRIVVNTHRDIRGAPVYRFEAELERAGVRSALGRLSVG